MKMLLVDWDARDEDSTRLEYEKIAVKNLLEFEVLDTVTNPKR